MLNNLLNNVKITSVLAKVASGTAVSYSDIVDMSGFDSVCFIAKLGAIVSGSVVTLAAQQNTLNSTAAMATLEGSATDTNGSPTGDDGVLVLDIVRPQERYLRAVLTSATQAAEKDAIIAIQYNAKDMPITQGTTVLDSDTLTSPDEA